MSLGNKLQKIINDEAAAKAKAEADKVEAQRRRDEKARRAQQNIVDRFIEHVNEKIAQGRVPRFKVENFVLQQWVKQCTSRGCDPEGYDIWLQAAKWAFSEGLEVKVVDEHDGMGMKSWVSLVVQPMEER